MSPVHRSSTNINLTPTTVVAMLDSSREEVTNEDSEDATTARRDRATAGICLQRGHSLQSEDNEIFHHTRRHAVHGGTRRHPRRSSSPPSLPSRTAVLSRPSAGSSLPGLPPIEELHSNIRSALIRDNRFALMDVVENMPPGLLVAILDGALPESFYDNMSSRVGELRRGHLATSDADSSNGAIHWFEGMFIWCVCVGGGGVSCLIVIVY